MKSKNMRSVSHVTCLGYVINVYKIMVGNRKGKRTHITTKARTFHALYVCVTHVDMVYVTNVSHFLATHVQ
jgi:hypothetical protein